MYEVFCLNERLLVALRAGGLILYARHGEATVGVDQPNLDFRNCGTQRNLSDTGRRQAEQFGDSMRVLQIPVSYPVTSSPFCRAVETAGLAFGPPFVQIDPALADVFRLNGMLTPYEQERILEVLRMKLELKPAPGSNRVIVAHGFPNGVGLGAIPDMGTVVVQPLGRGSGYRIIARLPLDDLTDLSGLRTIASN
jgi:hypothetical protein